MGKSDENIYFTKKALGGHIAELRKKLGWSTNDLMNELIKRGVDSCGAPSTISGWEQGRKCPSIGTAVMLASIFGVTLDELVGLPSRYMLVDDEVGEAKKIEIPIYELCNCGGMPVYVEFIDQALDNQWGLVSVDGNMIIFEEEAIEISRMVNCIFWVKPPHHTWAISSQGKMPLPHLDNLRRLECMYIEVKSSSPKIRGEYNGWYRHNESKTALINSAGLTLPYEGLNKNYFVYDFVLDDCGGDN